MADATGLFAVLLMAGVTYGLRIAGLALGNHLPASGKAADALERLPGLVLVALVAPAVLDLGWLGIMAAACAAAAWRAFGGSLPAAIVAGSGAVALGRLL